MSGVALVRSFVRPSGSVCKYPLTQSAYSGAATAIAVLFGEGMFVLRLWASYRENKLSQLLLCYTPNSNI